eukprot:scaffold1373_cov367-Pinguiococcus_pyrenoidosus.AAC.26
MRSASRKDSSTSELELGADADAVVCVSSSELGRELGGAAAPPGGAAAQASVPAIPTPPEAASVLSASEAATAATPGSQCRDACVICHSSHAGNANASDGLCPDAAPCGARCICRNPDKARSPHGTASGSNLISCSESSPSSLSSFFASGEPAALAFAFDLSAAREDLTRPLELGAGPGQR